MKAMRELLTGVDSSHKISAMRVSVMVVVSSIMGAFVAHNVMAMIHGHGFVSMGWNETLTLLSVLGAKAFQHKSEASTSTGSGVHVSYSSSVGASSTINNEDSELSKAK